jgi:hypothetical protein
MGKEENQIITQAWKSINETIPSVTYFNNDFDL